MDKQVEKLMKALGISEEEALQVIEDDKAIDKGEKLFELKRRASPQDKATESQPSTSSTLPKGKDLKMWGNATSLTPFRTHSLKLGRRVWKSPMQSVS